MRLVVADTSPIFYLLAIGHIGLLPQLFGKILVPDAVYKELSHPAAPSVVGAWVSALPAWIEVTPVTAIDDASLQMRGEGERAAITLSTVIPRKVVLANSPASRDNESSGKSFKTGDTKQWSN
jgi:predicted nucleic acid-binding protein